MLNHVPLQVSGINTYWPATFQGFSPNDLPALEICLANRFLETIVCMHVDVQLYKEGPAKS